MKADNSKRKIPGIPFKKGICPNPGGRPKLPEEIKASLVEYAVKAIEFQYAVLKGKIKAPVSVRVKCSELLADRGLGKAVQAVDVSGGPMVIMLSHDTEGI